MNIKQASEQSGVSAPNIRFYEKEGLFTPARRQGNDYRDYTAGNIRTLKLIRMLRMLDVPLPTIKVGAAQAIQPLRQCRCKPSRPCWSSSAAQLAAAMQFLRRPGPAGLRQADIAGCGRLPDPHGEAPPRSRASSPAGCRITARWRRCSIRSTFSLSRRAASTPRRSLRRLCRPTQRNKGMLFSPDQRGNVPGVFAGRHRV